MSVRRYDRVIMKDGANQADGPAEVGFLQKPFWCLVLLALVAGQVAATLGLFGSDRSWRNLTDDRPILDGRHPLHLYHGLLGAQSWRAGGFGSCYDPAFQAGYPKTPIFDSGSRPAELFLLLGHDRPAAYKIGLMVCCALVPLVFAEATRLLELGPATACLAALLGVLVWWTNPIQRLLQQGELDWLFGGLVLVLHAGLVVRFHRDPGPFAWMALLLTAGLGWFLHPVLWLGFGLLFVPFYVCVAVGHNWLWNFALWLAWGGGLLLNVGWLDDWIKHCWIQRPMAVAPAEQMRSSLMQWWLVDVRGESPDRMLAALVLGGGLLGVLALLARKRVAGGLTFGATAILLPALSAGSGFWEPLETVGASKLFVLACAFAIVPCATAMTETCMLLGLLTRHPLRGALMGTALLAGLAGWQRQDVAALIHQVAVPKPLTLGLNLEQQALIKTIRTSTHADSRILWEERPGHETPAWTALLPWQTERFYLGGLDPGAEVDHMYARLTATHLAGRPLGEWTEKDLNDFCERYNIGFVVCWSPATMARFRSWSEAELLSPLHESSAGGLFAVRRRPSFVLKGKARLAQADADRIALADVEPDNGEIVLSLHYQEGFHISPGPATAERVVDVHDPIPLLRIRLPGPVLRLTLTWGKP